MFFRYLSRNDVGEEPGDDCVDSESFEASGSIPSDGKGSDQGCWSSSSAGTGGPLSVRASFSSSTRFIGSETDFASSFDVSERDDSRLLPLSSFDARRDDPSRRPARFDFGDNSSVSCFIEYCLFMWMWGSYFLCLTTGTSLAIGVHLEEEENEELLVSWSLSARRLSTASSAIEAHLEEANEELFVISRLSAASSEDDEVLVVISIWASCFISTFRLSTASSAT